MALAQKIAECDPFTLTFAKASVNGTEDAQCWRQATEGAFKNYMLTVSQRARHLWAALVFLVVLFPGIRSGGRKYWTMTAPIGGASHRRQSHES